MVRFGGTIIITRPTMSRYESAYRGTQTAFHRSRWLDEFFISGEGIKREVLQEEICRFLGPEASTRPSAHMVRRLMKVQISIC